MNKIAILGSACKPNVLEYFNSRGYNTKNILGNSDYGVYYNYDGDCIKAESLNDYRKKYPDMKIIGIDTEEEEQTVNFDVL